MSLVNDKGILWNFLVSEVVCTQKVYDLGFRDVANLFAGDTKLQSIDSANIAVKNIETIPLFLLIDQVGTFL